MDRVELSDRELLVLAVLAETGEPMSPDQVVDRLQGKMELSAAEMYLEGLAQHNCADRLSDQRFQITELGREVATVFGG